MRALAALGLALATAGCDARGAAPLRPQPFTVETRAVAPGAADGRVGALRYAGGFEMVARGTSRFGGLSGLDVGEDGAVLMVTDGGDLVRGRLVLDGAGRLTGLQDLTIEGLVDEHGQAVSTRKSGEDAEGATFLPGGGFAVSFEREHRVLAYARYGAAAERRIDPARARLEGGARLGLNTGLEGLAAGADGLMLGSEKGRVWRCVSVSACREVPARSPGFGWGLTGLDALDDGPIVSTWRLFPLYGRWVSAIQGPDGTVLARLDGPLGLNAEGIAAVRTGDGWRLYVVADDGFGETGRNLLLAFDWRP